MFFPLINFFIYYYINEAKLEFIYFNVLYIHFSIQNYQQKKILQKVSFVSFKNHILRNIYLDILTIPYIIFLIFNFFSFSLLP